MAVSGVGVSRAVVSSDLQQQRSRVTAVVASSVTVLLRRRQHSGGKPMLAATINRGEKAADGESHPSPSNSSTELASATQSRHHHHPLLLRALPRRPMEVTHVVVAGTGVLHGGESAADELRCSLAEEGSPPLARCHPPSETRGRGAVALPWKSSPFAAGKITRCPLEFAVGERETPKGGSAIAATHHGHAPSSPTAAITILLGEKRRRGEGTAATRCSVLLLLLLREEDRRAKAAACSALAATINRGEKVCRGGKSHPSPSNSSTETRLSYAKPPSPPSTAAPCFAEKTDGGYACCCRWNGVLHGGESAADELRCSLAEEGSPPLARCHPPSKTRGRGAVALPWKSSPFAAGKITRCPLEFAVGERETPKGGSAIAPTHHGHAPSSPNRSYHHFARRERRRGEGTAATRCSVLLLLLLREEDRRAKAAACSAVRRRSRGDEGEREALLAGWSHRCRRRYAPSLLLLRHSWQSIEEEER
nr:hypothetical protein Iba_chr04dCG14450 [Ipomoea batatas]